MEHFCYQPWVGLDISPQGEFKPCCKYANNIANNLDDYLNSQDLVDLQNDFRLGNKPVGCKRCWDDEDAGIVSKRQLDEPYLNRNNSNVQLLSLPFGNSCNLACRICSSYSSSTWLIEEKKLQKYIPVKSFKHQRFYQDNEFIQKIKNLCHDVVYLQFPGGEPFLAGIDEHLDFLDHLLTLSPANISLHYITNTTIFPKQEFWDRWVKFKNVDIQLSIDGIEEQFEYNRWPAKWDNCNLNIAKYIAQRDQLPNIQISVSHSVSIFTVYYLPEFIKWCLQNNLGKPYLGMVADPKIYNIKVLPQHIKDQIVKKLSRYNLTNVLQYMNSEDLSDQFTDAGVMTNRLDQLRNQDFKVVFPDFYQLLKDTECQI
jgi:MoaA/NifB/PqqE/SkfB family radical SAM enzyme